MVIGNVNIKPSRVAKILASTTYGRLVLIKEAAKILFPEHLELEVLKQEAALEVKKEVKPKPAVKIQTRNKQKPSKNRPRVRCGVIA